MGKHDMRFLLGKMRNYEKVKFALLKEEAVDEVTLNDITDRFINGVSNTTVINNATKNELGGFTINGTLLGIYNFTIYYEKNPANSYCNLEIENNIINLNDDFVGIVNGLHNMFTGDLNDYILTEIL